MKAYLIIIEDYRGIVYKIHEKAYYNKLLAETVAEKVLSEFKDKWGDRLIGLRYKILEIKVGVD